MAIPTIFPVILHLDINLDISHQSDNAVYWMTGGSLQ